MIDKKQLRTFVRKKNDLKSLLMNGAFAKTLSSLANSSLSYYGFRRIPVRLIWDSSDEAPVAYISDTECVINLDSPLDQGYSYIQRKRLALGKLTHEVFGHGLHTDFAFRNYCIKKFEIGEMPLTKYFKQTSNYDSRIHKEICELSEQCTDAFASIYFDIENIVEDPTIEYLACQKYPGMKKYVDFLITALSWHFNKNVNTGTAQVDDYSAVRNALLRQARDCSFANDLANFPVLADTQIVFDNIESYYTFEDRVVASCYIINILWDDYIKPLMKEAIKNQAIAQIIQQMLDAGMISSSDEQNQRTQNGEANSQSQGQSSQGSNPCKSGSQKSSGNSGNSESGSASGEKQGDGDGSKTEQSDEKGKEGQSGETPDSVKAEYDSSSDGGESGESPKRFLHDDNEARPDGSDMAVPKGIMDAFDKLAEESTSEFIDRMTAEAINSDRSALEDQYENNLIESDVYGSDFHKDYPYMVRKITESDGDGYRAVCEGSMLKSISHNLANKIIKAVRIRQKGNILYRQDEGEMVDIHAYSEGSDKCFMSINQPTKKPLMACSVMIDESGSMSGDRIVAARNAAIVLERFCRELKIPIHVFGHDDSGGCIIYNYIEHADPATPARAYKLAHMRTGGCNRDGFAIRYGLAKLLKRPEANKLFFLISDGRPNSSGYGTSQAIKDVADIKKVCKRKGVTLIALAIGDDLETLKEIYGASLVDARNLNDLPKNVTKMLLNQLRKEV